MDEDERTSGPEFDSCEEAIAYCKEIVDKSLRFLYRKNRGISAQRLYEDFQDFGDDPFIRSADPDCKFSGWGYAKKRASDIVKEFGGNDKPSWQLNHTRDRHCSKPSAAEKPGFSQGTLGTTLGTVMIICIYIDFILEMHFFMTVPFFLRGIML